MKKKNRTLRMALALLFAVCCLLTDITPLTLSAPVRAVTQADIDAKQKEADALAAQKKQLEAELAELAQDKNAALKRKELLDQQIAVIVDEVAATEAQIANYEQLIAQTEQELAEKEAEEQARYELFCARVRAMEENGTVSYWATLFKSKSFSDLLARLDMINEIMESDKRVIDSLQAIQKEIEAEKASLEDQRAQVQQERAALKAKKAELESQRATANEIIAQIKANEAENKSLVEQMAREEDELERQIEKLMQQYAAERFGNAEGEFLWPVKSRYVTSRAGIRSAASTNYVGSTNHRGIDIGRVYYTMPVWASKSGRVTISQYNSVRGNYVVINHGDGTQTLYQHLSSRSVSVGQSVTQGQVIGITGSTGHSTGPHLHYEIWVNGSPVNPLDYFNTSSITFSPNA